MTTPEPPIKRKRIPKAQAQASILQACDDLFYKEGIRAVSVDSLVERAGLNKMSFYRQFASKDELILAYLKRKQQEFWEEWDAALAKHPGDARAQILQLVRDFSSKACKKGYRGCCFLNIAAEFPDPSHPARQFVFAHKKELVERLTRLTRTVSANDPTGLAFAFALLLEGTYAASQTFGVGCDTLQVLPTLAERLLNQE